MYTPRVWKDRAVQFANRYLKSGETSLGVTLTADPGTVTEAGTPVNAANMNQLENAVAAAHVTADAAVKRSGDIMTGGLTATALAAANNSDAVLYLEDTGAPSTSFRIKRIFSSRNVGGGSDWLFRQSRPSDNATQDYTITAGPGGLSGFIWHAGMLRSSNGFLEWNNGGTWQGVGGVKSIQRGVASASGSGTTNVTITAVNLSKSIVTLDAVGYNSASDQPNSIYATLTSPTNIAFVGFNGINTLPVAWQVIEHY
jgi:hypothetical protein